MHKLFLLIMVSLGVIACGNNTSKEDATLSQPPYKKLTDSIDKAPKDAGLYYRRGSLLYKNGEMQLAENDLRTSWQLDPGEENALRLTSILKQKNPDTAISFLQEALKKIPNSIGLHILLAKGYESKNQLDKALTIADDIIKQYPGELDALILKSEILKHQNQNKEALSILEQAYNYAPGDVDLVHQLAFEYADSKNPKVLLLADSLIKVDVEKRHAEPYYFKGLYYENTGNWKEAVKHFDEAIQHDFNFLDAYMDKGQTYYDQKKYAEALKTFQLTTTVFPSESLPYFWLGKTQQALGDKNEARLNYQRAYGLDKTFTEAKDSADHLK
ncbi:MAG TPA: tetratricopeptide repeat protein [Flavisolibacter sp.]|nr:tetratricopeptide repeat protein [Flavisolibacter sp.]